MSDREGGRRPVILLAVGFLLLLAVAGVNAWLAQENRRQNDLVTHTRDVQLLANKLLTAMVSAEASQRNYLLVGDARTLARFRDSASAARTVLQALQRATKGDSRQQGRLQEIRPVLTERLDILERTARLAQAGNTAAAMEIVRAGQGIALMRTFRAQIAGVEEAEERLLTVRRGRAESLVDLLMVLSVLGLLLAAGMAISAVAAMLRYARSLESANEAVVSLNHDLEAKVRERTADLQAANDEIQRFAYIVSHDLRSPLVNVMGFTAELDAAGGHARALLDRVEGDRPDLPTRDEQLAIREDLPEALGFIRTSTSKMDRLINAILKLSREGRRTLTAERIDMTALLSDIAKALHQQAEAAEAQVTIDPLPALTGDRLALDQVFGNLVENAIKYLQPGRPGVVHVSGRQRGPLVEITVTDNGRGIDKADRERVFELFRRAGVQDRPGEGIGLANVRALVRRLGGTIELESEPGQGSRFIVTLPSVNKEGAGE